MLQTNITKLTNEIKVKTNISQRSYPQFLQANSVLWSVPGNSHFCLFRYTVLHCQEYHFTADKRDAKFDTRYVNLSMESYKRGTKGVKVWSSGQSPVQNFVQSPLPPRVQRIRSETSGVSIYLPVCIKFGMSCTRRKRYKKKGSEMKLVIHDCTTRDNYSKALIRAQ